jgi:hypothetical protein
MTPSEEQAFKAGVQSGKTMMQTPRVISPKSAPIRQDRCAFCRRRLWDRAGISVTCKRHKNKPINWRFYYLPFAITDHES